MAANRSLKENKRRIPATLLSDAEVIGRILDHIDHKTTDRGTGIWQEPVDNYMSQERFELEVNLIRQHYTVYCPSASLTESGSYVARDVGGLPMVVVRGEDGQVRAFKNVCRHRGVQVAEEGSGQAKSFVCPYHAWTYGLDGSLRAVPHQDGFPNLKKCERGLVPVNCSESQGLIFVGLQNGNAISDMDKLSDTPSLIPEGYKIHEETHIELPANWKIVLESFLEGYHIRSLHTHSFYPLQYDNLNVVEQFGPHSRVSFPYRSVEALRSRPASHWTADARLTYVYQLFPNAIVATHPGFKAVIVFEPLAVDKTKQINYIVTNSELGDAEQVSRLNSAIAVANSGTDEDRSMVFSGQRGLAAQANEHLEFGLFESAIVHFHSTLSQALTLAAD
ncbi:MAG: phenylpropionate dioxygenase-like ring-hydroxylating dioxygenase large terminal subunit [Halieaceae bacterium]|jgi:phenylpropionate dioxygenase-like ring-hydroxylating dioxygenase large terminal subunit